MEYNKNKLNSYTNGYDPQQYPQYNQQYQQYQQYGHYPRYDPQQYEQYGQYGQYGNYDAQQYQPFYQPYQAYPMPYQVQKKKGGWVKWLVLGIVIVIAAVISVYFVYKGGSRRAIPGLSEPVQTQAQGQVKKVVNGYNVDITFLYSYSVDALVVHTKDYSGSGIGDKLSPLDLGLAWGDVAATNKSVDYHWSQSGRWIYWHVDSYADIAVVGSTENVNRQCSNNHIIPASSSVKDTVEKIRRGDRVRLEGYLVNIDAVNPDGAWFEWHTSTSREDTGDGACEVFYVTKAEIVA